MTKVFPKWAVAVFFAAFLLLGFVTAGDYGPTWDEQDEMDILRMNLWEYTRAFGGDESAFEKRAAQENTLTISRLTPISEGIEQDHGIAMFYPLSGVVMDESLTEGQRSLIWHMGCWAVFTLGAYALYACCRQLGLSQRAALMAPAFLLLSPRFFAQGHFNNKDITLMALALCVLWQGLKLLKKPSFVTGMCFSMFGALAANAKVAGAALWGLCALIVLVAQLVNRRMTGRVWAVAGVTVVSFFVFYALITPAMWADPAAFVNYLVTNALSFQRWQNDVLFRGTVFHLVRESLPWYYLPYMILATTPLWVLALIAFGTVKAALRVFKAREDEALSLVMVVLMWVLPLGFAVLSRTHVYNGWRHFYFVYGPMLVLAAWGISKLWRRRVFAIVMAVCMALGAVGVATQHPYQYAYYQPVVQLRGTDFNELDYWNISARDALEALAEQTEGEIRLAAADLWSDNAIQKAILTMDEETVQRFVLTAEGDYVLSNPTYAHFSGFDADGYEKIVEITSYGQPIMRIFKLPVEEVQ
ncbi:MAG: hypothetical protein IKJ26_10290 [Clostridia bacterium]|nr:hypothetical protein [Clostridia bacterium]